MIAFLSRGKTNLDYWVYPNLNHSFQDVTVDPSLPTAGKSEEVWSRVWRWIKERE
jgi:dipeptidyl aminopeptidase/acylaminoacyl peptidase